MIIAEIGHNWNLDINTACDMIEMAAWRGADAVKFQLYNTDLIKKPGDTNYEELKAAQLTKGNLATLYETALLSRVEFMVSIFDRERFKWIAELDIDIKRHKVASRIIWDLELIGMMADSGLPIIASLGDWPDEEVPQWFPEGTDFLKCVTRRDVLRNGFNGIKAKEFRNGPITGFSDHTIGLEHAKNAINQGAKIIEKHYTHNKNWRGWDQPGSMLPEELEELVEYYRRINGRDTK